MHIGLLLFASRIRAVHSTFIPGHGANPAASPTGNDTLLEIVRDVYATFHPALRTSSPLTEFRTAKSAPGSPATITPIMT